MQNRSAEIAIIGAGPAGAHLASRLAAEGRDVVLFDPKGAWEKPCGGGVPTRAIREFAFLLESSNYPHKLVRRVTMISPLERRVTVTLDEPFAVYSREVLNGLVLDRAIESGALFVRDAASDFTRESEGWLISTNEGEQWHCDFLVGADGAASFTRRRLIGIFPKQDLALAFGYNVVSDHCNGREHKESDRCDLPLRDVPIDTVVMQFPKNFTGYVWAFPRVGMMNFGIASKLGERTSDELRNILLTFMHEYYDGRMPEPSRLRFFGAKIPILDRQSWSKLRTGGDEWALVGDAAGFVDPITGEGIYYALKSADLLADAFERGNQPGNVGSEPVGVSRLEPDRGSHLTSPTSSSVDHRMVAARYEKLWRQEFGSELERASQMLGRFYHGYFCGMPFSDAMIRIARFHRGVQAVLIRLILGEQSYLTLKRDLLRRIFRFF